MRKTDSRLLNTMTDQTQQDHPTAATILPSKRRRGRPRKDETPAAKKLIFQTPTTPEMRQKDNMLGQIVSGSIDGSFDAGYFLSVKLGNDTTTTLRGLIFEPGRFSPITAANDIAPQVKMYHRSQVITLQDQQNVSLAGQQVLPSDALTRNDNRCANQDQMIKTQSQFTPLLENLRMVEENEVMEVFEVANQAEVPELNEDQGKGTLVCSDLNSSNDVINLDTSLDQKLEINRAQEKLIPTINPEEVQTNDLTHEGQGNQDFQPHQTTRFIELNSVAQENEVQPSDPIQNELHYFDMSQHNVTSDTQVLPQESISESVDFTMEKMRNSPNMKEEQSTDVGTEVKVVGSEETSHMK